MIVLLIEDNPDDALIIEVELENQAGRELRLEHVTTLTKGLQRLATGGVDVVLTDLGLPDSQGLDTFRRIREGAPTVPVVVLTGNTDESVGLAAVGEGAQEFLCKSELRSGSLMRTIRFAIQRGTSTLGGAGTLGPAKQGMVIGFVGSKGGVGTSTVALNVALSLARDGKAVTVVELRPYFGTFALQLRLNPIVNLGNLFEELTEPFDTNQLRKRLGENPLVQHPSGLRVLFAPQRLEQCVELEPRQHQAMVQYLADTSEYLIFDVTSQPSALNRAVLGRCHRIIPVVEREPLAVEAAQTLLDVFDKWELQKAVVGAVVVSRGINEAALRMPDVQSQLGCPILGVVPPAVELCQEAINRGSPLVQWEFQHPTATTLVELARRLSAEQVKPMVF